MFPIRSASLTIALATLLGVTTSLHTPAAELAAIEARPATGGTSTAFDGVVEAVRQTVVAAQVPGAVVHLEVKVGDRVSTGQVLLRLDARAADQNAAASAAQVQASRAALDLASKDVERQRQLFQQNYISRAAFERAESEFKSTQAQVNAQLAQSGAARTQTGFYVVRAPFAGVVSDVPVSLGDMAMPGRPLITLYDPSALRLTAAVPQSVVSRLPAGELPRVEFPALAAPARWIEPLRTQILPTLDPATHTVQLRADLPAGLVDVAPGMYGRVWLPVAPSGAAAGAAPVLSVLQSAVVRRAELTALYVLDAADKPVLRQVRLGHVDGDRVEVLTGLTAGERVVTDPQAAARVRPNAR